MITGRDRQPQPLGHQRESSRARLSRTMIASSATTRMGTPRAAWSPARRAGHGQPAVERLHSVGKPAQARPGPACCAPDPVVSHLDGKQATVAGGYDADHAGTGVLGCVGECLADDVASRGLDRAGSRPSRNTRRCVVMAERQHSSPSAPGSLDSASPSDMAIDTSRCWFPSCRSRSIRAVPRRSPPPAGPATPAVQVRRGGVHEVRRLTIRSEAPAGAARIASVRRPTAARPCSWATRPTRRAARATPWARGRRCAS